jgi:hypothetical protein
MRRSLVENHKRNLAAILNQSGAIVAAIVTTNNTTQNVVFTFSDFAEMTPWLKSRLQTSNK